MPFLFSPKAKMAFETPFGTGKFKSLTWPATYRVKMIFFLELIGGRGEVGMIMQACSTTLILILNIYNVSCSMNHALGSIKLFTLFSIDKEISSKSTSDIWNSEIGSWLRKISTFDHWMIVHFKHWCIFISISTRLKNRRVFQKYTSVVHGPWSPCESHNKLLFIAN